jgi:hypothetical protein
MCGYCIHASWICFQIEGGVNSLYRPLISYFVLVERLSRMNMSRRVPRIDPAVCDGHIETKTPATSLVQQLERNRSASANAIGANDLIQRVS